MGWDRELERAIVDAFPGSRLGLPVVDGRMTVALEQPGMLRPLAAPELSDGTLQYLLLTAAMLSAGGWSPSPTWVVSVRSVPPSTDASSQRRMSVSQRHSKVRGGSHTRISPGNGVSSSSYF